MSARPRKPVDKAAPTVASGILLTPGLTLLLNDDVFASRIAAAWPEIEKVMFQLQRDSEDASLLPLRRQYDTFQAFAARGDAVREQLKQSKK